MKSKTAILLIVLFGLISIFLWGTLNFGYNFTDTPTAYPELHQGNIDVFAIPAVISAFAILILVPIIIFVSVSSRKLKIIFIPLSGIIIFLIFILTVTLIVGSTTPWGQS